MKREFVFAIGLIGFVLTLIGSSYIFGEEKVTSFVRGYIVILFMTTFYLGQYSMKFPKWSDK